MIVRRPADARGHANHGWLDSRHTFSFADYYDGAHMGFRALRVINEDRVQPGHGFGTHQHRDMEILSYVLSGSLAHKDSMGTGSTITPGDVQRMTAGTGVLHSEQNPSTQEAVHFLQIWLLPERRGLAPGYEQKRFERADKAGRLRLIASRDGRDGSVTVHQDVDLYAAVLDDRNSVTHVLGNGRHAWIQVVHGSVSANGQPLEAGDGAAISEEREVEIVAAEEAELLLFDLA